MTVNGAVHLNDYDDYESYINSDRWSKHEVRHIQQAEEIFGGSGSLFVIYSIVGYIFAFGHDDAPLEIDADNHAHGRDRDLFGGGLWPVFRWLSDLLL